MQATRGCHPERTIVLQCNNTHIGPRHHRRFERRHAMNFVTLPFLGLVQAMSALASPNLRAAHAAPSRNEAPRKHR
jgi:hypothetical protein